MSEEVKEGDVVRLKSGGVNMTVTSVGDYYGTLSAWCVWYDGKKNVEDTFAVVALEKVSNTTQVRAKPVGWASLPKAKFIPPGTT